MNVKYNGQYTGKVQIRQKSRKLKGHSFHREKSDGIPVSIVVQSESDTGISLILDIDIFRVYTENI